MARLEIIDFPTDHYNYTADARKALTVLFGKALFSKEAYEATAAMVEFYTAKLGEAKEHLDGYLKAQADAAKQADEANRALEAPQEVPQAPAEAVQPKPTAKPAPDLKGKINVAKMG